MTQQEFDNTLFTKKTLIKWRQHTFRLLWVDFESGKMQLRSHNGGNGEIVPFSDVVVVPEPSVLNTTTPSRRNRKRRERQ
jgi:hypothetical protein